MSAGGPRVQLTIRARLTLTYGALVAVSVATMVGLLYVVMRYGPSYSPQLTHPTVSCSVTASREPAPQRSADSASPRPGGEAPGRGQGLGASGGSPTPSAATDQSAPGAFSSPGAGSGRDSASASQAEQIACRPRAGLVSIDVSSKADFLRALLLFSVAVGAVLVLISLVVGWFVARRMLAPLQQITTTARGIADSTLHERIDLAGPKDEIKELADTFDAMLVRLDRAFQAQRRFAANASHELRTPLATMRTILQVALASPEPDDLREAGAQLLILNERSTDITEALLTLARADHGAITREPVDLAKTAGELCAQARPAACQAGVRINGPVGEARVHGDPILLRQLAANLIDNAVKHNHRGGAVSATVARSQDGWVRLAVRNSGPVLDQEAVDRAFEPFHRLDTRTHGSAARSAGYGLGLAIVHAIVRAHDGTLTATPIQPNGLEVSVSLPEQAAERSHRPGVQTGRVP
ncbi:sensor histidine kinase [Streptomyces sp. NPDC001288]|uniref:sensor histidine kinase n=1 Tax=unclassified Streptomyces TaxID=2593676 RepID=UPI003319B895